MHAAATQGSFCARRPGLVLAAAAAVAGLCALGLIRLRVETDPQRLWVGAGSQAAREKADYEVACTCLARLHWFCTGLRTDGRMQCILLSALVQFAFGPLLCWQTGVAR